MATYRYPPLPNVHTTASGDNAFDSETTDPDRLILGRSASLIADQADAVYLGGLGGAWTVSVSGEVVGGSGDYGIYLQTGITDTSTITVDKHGKVDGDGGIIASSPVTIKNHGLITQQSAFQKLIDLEGLGTNRIINTGTIQHFQIEAIQAGGAIDIVINSGKIVGAISLASGEDRLVNSGKIIGDVFLGADHDIVTNFRHVGHKIVSGFILPDPNSIQNALGTVDLGGGNDEFRGGSHAERLKDGDGSDIINLGGGRDTYIATGANTNFDLNDAINGGKGVDVYDASGTDDAVRINLDKVSHDGGAFATLALAGHSASGDDISGTFADKILNFELAHGGDNSDLIYGTNGANAIFGSGGFFDELFGIGGNDKLFGEAGFDLLVGGRGKDVLTGGTEGDIFAYSSIADSGPAKTARDVITDYEDETDRIDLSRIDANTKIAGDQLFNFLGTDVAFSGHRGDLRAHTIGAGYLIEGDLDGDKKADFAIEITNPGHTIVWSNTPGDDFDF